MRAETQKTIDGGLAELRQASAKPASEAGGNDRSNQGEGGKLTLLQVLGSVLAAGFGVQSKRNKVRDFTRGDFRQFVIVGLLMTALFVFGTIGLVHLVLELAT